MMRLDRLYIKKARKAGIRMEMYERYVDDSNQIAIVPPVGSRYDPITQKIVKDNFLVEQNETEETRLARVLKTIANSVQDGIVMEEDSPERNQNSQNWSFRHGMSVG